MRQRLETLKDSLASWVVRHAEGRRAKWWLFGVAFAESSFFPVPPDVLLVAILATGERVRAVMHATITTVGSVLGGLAGYALGFFFFQTVGVWLVATYHLESELLVVQKLFADNAFFAIFTAAFTPIPYKLFTISAGLFSINIITFVLASVLGRGMRFFAVAFVMKYLSQHVMRLFYKYFNIASLFFVLMLGIILYVFVVR